MDNNQINEKTDKKNRHFDVKKLILGLLMALLGVLLVVIMLVFREDDIPSDPGKKVFTFYGCFDTVGNIYSFSDDSNESFQANSKLAEDTLRYYHELFDIYEQHEGVSGLYEINKNAGEPVKVSAEVIEFLDFCIEMYELTDAEVNIAMGAVLKIHREFRENPQGMTEPDRAALEEAAKHTDINKIIIDREEMTVCLSDPEMSVDVGAVAKGYAVEKAAEKLRGEGADGYVIDVGGNLRIIGKKPSGEPFKTGIRDPFDINGYTEIIEIEDTSAVTSGEYERGHHIIDKDTLRSPNYFASVTVITENSGLADALSTALFCMDYEKGYHIVNTLDGVEVIWVFADGRVVKS